MIHGFTCVSSTWNCPLSPDEHYIHWSRWRRSARGWIVVVNSCMVDQNWRESSDGVVVCLIFVWLGCGDYRDGYVVVMARWEHVALNVSVTSVATPYFFYVKPFLNVQLTASNSTLSFSCASWASNFFTSDPKRFLNWSVKLSISMQTACWTSLRCACMGCFRVQWDFFHNSTDAYTQDQFMKCFPPKLL